LVSKVLYKDKNRGRFLFTFPHPSSNEGNVEVNPPWGTHHTLTPKSESMFHSVSFHASYFENEWAKSK
jgi:hypothetical protein